MAPPLPPYGLVPFPVYRHGCRRSGADRVSVPQAVFKNVLDLHLSAHESRASGGFALPARWGIHHFGVDPHSKSIPFSCILIIVSEMFFWDDIRFVFDLHGEKGSRSMVWTTLLTLAAVALGVDADLDGGDADFDSDSGGSEASTASEPAPAGSASNHSSGGEVTFGAEEKPASELIIAANGQGYESPSEFITGSNPWEPKN